MTRSCLFSLLLYAGLLAGYFYAFAEIWDPPATWIVPLIAGTMSFFALGGLWGARDRYRQWSLVSRAKLGMEPSDGARAAALGTIHPLGQPLLTPFSRTPCVLYEYEIRRQSTSAEKDGANDIGFGGMRMEPCVVRDAGQELKILGFPDLAEEREHLHGHLLAYKHAREFVKATTFEDLSGLQVLKIVSSVLDVMADDDGSVEKNWQRAKDAESWLDTDELDELFRQYPDGVVPNQPADAETARRELEAEEVEDDESLDEEDDEGGNSGILGAPQLVEKFIEPGAAVCVFGVFSQEHRALVPKLAQHSISLQIMRGTPEEIESQLRGSMVARFVGGLVALVVLHLALWGGTQLYLHHPTTKKARQADLEQAIRDEDLPAIEQLLMKGVDPNGGEADRSLLADVKSPEVAQLLLAHGADPNQPDQNGYTPLMNAARLDRPEIVKLLLAAGVNLDARHSSYNSTALMQALDAENPETVALLREAGAFDDTVDERNGQLVMGEEAPTIRACVAYIEAIHARDPARLKALSARDRPATFDDVDWDVWHNTRPAGPVDVTGYANDTAATMTVQGQAPKGFFVTWVFQLAQEAGEWKIVRERWLTKGLSGR